MASVVQLRKKEKGRGAGDRGRERESERESESERERERKGAGGGGVVDGVRRWRVASERTPNKPSRRGPVPCEMD